MGRLENYLNKINSEVYNEELVDKKVEMAGKQIFELYKNPQTLKNFKSFARGIFTPKGDLYMVDYDFEVGNKNQNVYIHSDIVAWLNELGILKDCSYEEGDDPANYMDEFLSVERKGTTDDFLLAESYPEDLSDDEEFEDILLKWKKLWDNKQRRFNLILSQFE